MIDLSQWQMPQYLIVALFTVSVILNVVRHGKPMLKHFDAAGTEINDNSFAIINFVMIMSLLAWGGFFS